MAPAESHAPSSQTLLPSSPGIQCVSSLVYGLSFATDSEPREVGSTRFPELENGLQRGTAT